MQWIRCSLLSATSLVSISRLYDPLGLLTPFTILFKILFRRLCVEKIGDQPLTNKLLLQWERLLHSLKWAQTTIPHCYLSGRDEKEACNLIGFCNASRQAYAAVVHIRIQTTSGCSMRFVAAKSRVSPLQDHTIPHLELLGAILLSRLMVNIVSALNSELTLMPLSVQRLCCSGSKGVIKSGVSLWKVGLVKFTTWPLYKHGGTVLGRKTLQIYRPDGLTRPWL